MAPRRWKTLTDLPFSLRRTLQGGQVFRWVPVEKSDTTHFIGVVGDSVIELRQHTDRIEWQVAAGNAAAKAVEAQLHDYFQLAVSMHKLEAAWGELPDDTSPLVAQWKSVTGISAESPRKRNSASNHLRVIRQDPYECLVTFLCTQNNNAARIALMVDKLCKQYGTAIGEARGRTWFTFPSLKQLIKDGDDEGALERSLRDLGFGYRASYVEKSVAMLAGATVAPGRGGKAGKKAAGSRYIVDSTHPEFPLMALRDASHSHLSVVEALTALPGVGRKVADCIALFSLDKPDVVPVDVHILRLSRATLSDRVDFAGTKTLTPTIHNAIQECFKSDFGPYAGWAHSIMFHSEMTAEDTSVRKRKRSASKDSDAQPPAKKDERKEKKTRSVKRKP
ncbi:N-glycosylase/DNA lyase OGG1 [Diplonema papillatum]|nr:N-glycosylase/DNA lyase OGG1 [Diplonema papillatum]KAJ9446406.1 N-glycosylase/DNA lyase OGG1 [Diplonema papillatum]